jgi:hypothetical protein
MISNPPNARFAVGKVRPRSLGKKSFCSIDTGYRRSAEAGRQALPLSAMQTASFSPLHFGSGERAFSDNRLPCFPLSCRPDSAVSPFSISKMFYFN